MVMKQSKWKLPESKYTYFISMTRQNLPVLECTRRCPEEGVRKGVYVYGSEEHQIAVAHTDEVNICS